MAQQVRALHPSDVLRLARQVGIGRVESHDLHEFAGVKSTPAEVVAIHAIEVLEKEVFRQRRPYSEWTAQFSRVITFACLKRWELLQDRLFAGLVFPLR